MTQDERKPQLHRYSHSSSRLLLGLTVLLAACGTFEVGLVPTPTPTPALLRYINGAYGFAFTYPSEWSVTEDAHTVWLRKNTLVLRIGYKRVDEAEEIGASLSVPTEGTVYVQKLTFLGQTMPAEATIYNRKLKAITYHPARPEASEDLVFAISLTDAAGERDLEAYEEVDISDTVLEEVRAILESFERMPAMIEAHEEGADAAPQPTETPAPRATRRPDWAQYVNAEYGFSFAYPPSWSLTQTAGGGSAPFGPGADAVQLLRGDAALTIEVQRIGEDHDLGVGRTSVGEAANQGSLLFMGEAITAQVLSSGSQVNQILFRHQTSDLDFFVILAQDQNSVLNHEDFQLSEPIQEEAEAILSSFAPYP